MVWFNDDRDEWLQMRQTVMKVAPVSTTTDVNSRRDENEASYHQQQEQSTEPAVTGPHIPVGVD